jgi:hypothetical protein
MNRNKANMMIREGRMTGLFKLEGVDIQWWSACEQKVKQGFFT